MYVNMTTVATGEEPPENATIVGEEMLGWLRGVEGFKGMLLLYQPGTTIGLTFWEDEEVSERTRPLRLQFLERLLNVADVEIEKIEGFQVVFNGLGR